MIEDETFAVDTLVDLVPPVPNKNDLDNNRGNNGGGGGGGGYTAPPGQGQQPFQYPPQQYPPGYAQQPPFAYPNHPGGAAQQPPFAYPNHPGGAMAYPPPNR
jgi:hypothetical protein